MHIKDKTFKIVNLCYIVFNVLLWIMMIYLMIDSMVSLKYETEKEAINLHTNPASDYIKQTTHIISLFVVYITLNILYIGIMGRKMKNQQ